MTAIVGKGPCYKTLTALGIKLALTGKHKPLRGDFLSVAFNPMIGIHCLVSGVDGTAEFKVKVDQNDFKMLPPKEPTYEGAIASVKTGTPERMNVLPVEYAKWLMYTKKSNPYLLTELEHLNNTLRKVCGDGEFGVRIDPETWEFEMQNSKNRRSPVGALSRNERASLLTVLSIALASFSPLNVIILDEEIAGVSHDTMRFIYWLLECAIRNNSVSQAIVVHDNVELTPENWHIISRSAIRRL
jgi:hypothetical protein